MRIAVSGRHARAYIYAHRAQRVKLQNMAKDYSDVFGNWFSVVVQTQLLTGYLETGIFIPKEQ